MELGCAGGAKTGRPTGTAGPGRGRTAPSGVPSSVATVWKFLAVCEMENGSFTVDLPIPNGDFP